jgi:hypothetical protein
MQDRGNADLGTEMLGVGGDCQHRLRGGLEQEIIDHGLVLVCMAPPRVARGDGEAWGLRSCTNVSDL